MKYLLRWKFEFFDHKPSRCGSWSLPATRAQDTAAFVDKTNLRAAVIEGKNRETKEIKTVLVLDGHDFANFQWLSEARFGGGGVAYSVRGLRAVSRDYNFDVLNDGEIVKTIRTEQEKKYHYEGFGK